MSQSHKLNGPFYLAKLWNALRDAFNLRQIPNVCITMGFPSRRARSRASNRAPGEILVQEWRGSDAEKALVSIHPERFEDVEQVARAVLFVIGNEVYGSRRNLGSLTLGIEMNKETGDLGFTNDDKGKHAEIALSHIIRSLGHIPPGFAEMPEPKQVQRTKAKKYSCITCKTNIRYANGTPLQALCLHAGKPQYGQPATPFALELPKEKKTTSVQPPVEPVVPAPPAVVAPKTSARNFGVVEATV